MTRARLAGWSQVISLMPYKEKPRQIMKIPSTSSSESHKSTPRATAETGKKTDADGDESDWIQFMRKKGCWKFG